MNERIDVSMGNDVTMVSGRGKPLGHIDQYELLRELGGGGFGCVYLAKDSVAGVEVAVKGLPPEVRHNKEEIERIRENFALVSRLHHPNIAAALVLHPVVKAEYASRDVAEKLRVFERDTMMVMEYAPGVTLSQWCKQFPERKVPVETATHIVRQIASALDYAHGEKIVHRDVKPANVMIETKTDGSLVARVLDFGLAAEIRSSMGRVSREIRDTSGTRPYMAPEQWRGAKQGPATDQYALGVIFYELMTGVVPFASAFECGDPMIMLTALTTQAVEIPSDLPKEMRNALERVFAKAPEERFASCADFITALGGGKVSRKGIGQPATRIVSPGRRSPAKFVVFGCLAAAALVGASVFGYLRHQENVRIERARLAEQERQRRAQLEELERQRRARAEEVARKVSLGYVRVAGAGGEDTAVWKVGSPHPATAGLVADAVPETWRSVKPGYDWDGVSGLVWKQGREHPEHRHWFTADLPDEWRPEPGYASRVSGAFADLTWAPGTLHAGKRASSDEGVWETQAACRSCSGRGRVTVEDVCGKCQGRGNVANRVRCGICSGSGKVAGRTDCSTCGGSGTIQADCKQCGPLTRNDGQVVLAHGVLCTNCGGKGTVVNQQAAAANMANAFSAMGGGGWGALARMQPMDMLCPLCQGLGGKNCPTCSGTGHVRSQCGSCRGSGRMDSSEGCRNCNGSGSRTEYGPCPSCANGRVRCEASCSNCEGSGKVWQR